MGLYLHSQHVEHRGTREVSIISMLITNQRRQKAYIHPSLPTNTALKPRNKVNFAKHLFQSIRLLMPVSSGYDHIVRRRKREKSASFNDSVHCQVSRHRQNVCVS